METHVKVKEGPRIYNLFPRLAGAMKGWTAHMERARQMGFNWIYINPFHYSGFSGSIYSIKDYYAFNPLLINQDDEREPVEQLKEVVEAANDMDLRLMMDLVINHTAIDSVLITEHKDWYKLTPEGKINNPKVYEGGKEVKVWGDLAEIDNENSPDIEGLRAYWLDLIYYYLDVGFHGFRCDAAYKVPPSMWEYLIDNAKRHEQSALFFAETLGCEIEDVINLAKAGFDYTFNSSKWWDFQQPWCMNQYRENAQWTPSISFPESHDCNRLIVDLKGNVGAVKMRYTFAALFSTGVMIPMGFEYGFRKKFDVVTTVPFDWEEIHIDLTPFITQMNYLKASYQVFNEDNPIDIVDTDNPHIFAFTKTSHDGTEKALIIINKSMSTQERFYCQDLKKLFNHEGIIVDISPEHHLDVIPDEFDHTLWPNQVRILYCVNKG
jgi:starch synthase (maltosyl-transferring)